MQRRAKTQHESQAVLPCRADVHADVILLLDLEAERGDLVTQVRRHERRGGDAGQSLLADVEDRHCVITYTAAPTSSMPHATSSPTGFSEIA